MHGHEEEDRGLLREEGGAGPVGAGVPPLEVRDPDWRSGERVFWAVLALELAAGAACQVAAGGAAGGLLAAAAAVLVMVPAAYGLTWWLLGRVGVLSVPLSVAVREERLALLPRYRERALGAADGGGAVVWNCAEEDPAAWEAYVAAFGASVDARWVTFGSLAVYAAVMAAVLPPAFFVVLTLPLVLPLAGFSRALFVRQGMAAPRAPVWFDLHSHTRRRMRGRPGEYSAVLFPDGALWFCGPVWGRDFGRSDELVFPHRGCRRLVTTGVSRLAVVRRPRDGLAVLYVDYATAGGRHTSTVAAVPVPDAVMPRVAALLDASPACTRAAPATPLVLHDWTVAAAPLPRA